MLKSLVILATEQLSDIVGPTTVTSAVHNPASRFCVWSAAQVMVGSITSTTVTTAVHEEEFKLSSVTIKRTSFAPKSSQSKDVVLINRETGPPQPSEEPPSTSAAVIVASPLASNSTVMF